MFRKILIANRGEIALRVIAACKDLGIATVAIYSEPDRKSAHVHFADEHVCVGPARAAASYLDIPSVISAALITKAEAIHPGYGFLSENADFAQACSDAGLSFIGPKPEVMRRMGLKQQARQAMSEAGIPILPGSRGVMSGELNLADGAAEMASEIGYPVLIKASAGGGGRGMRIVNDPQDLSSLLSQASQEAAASFGNGDVYLEKLVECPRHIEFQFLADHHGAIRVLGERECSIQRRHQKLIEESPSVAVNTQLRDEMSDQVAFALSRAGYTNAGTAEFLMDQAGKLYFIEVNARIQVEHPVTEAVTRTDLVKAQIRIAAGEHLSSILPTDTTIRGHAIECRINAEHPETFRPSPGIVSIFQPPGGIGIRVETALFSGAEVLPHYDSLIAKVIAHGQDRTEAIARMQRALQMFRIEGIHTSIPFHLRILSNKDFVAGRIDTGLLTRI